MDLNRSRPRLTRKSSASGVSLAFTVAAMFCASREAGALDFDPAKLPPAATNIVDFARDIQPILERSCLRCHGPEKPKSRFRLDNRESALRGGDDGVDIIPGASVKSALLYYVARVVPDMEMPPEDRGEPLSAAEDSLLRAWIDQGAPWATNSPQNQPQFSLTPTLRWIGVSGNRQQFEEHYWQPDGFNGGASHFDFSDQVDADTRVATAGHLLRDDYRLTLEIERADVGFVHTGWEQYRKYFNDTGGYYPPFSPAITSLGRDLNLDIGRAWFDLGIILPHWPTIVLGYEYQYQQGNKSTLAWGDVLQNGNDRKIAPASEGLDEGTHIVKLDLEEQVAGVRLVDSFRAEFYRLNKQSTNLVAYLTTTDDLRDHYHHCAGANTLTVEKQMTGWAFVSGGYNYSKLSADSTLTAQSPEVTGPVASQITLSRESHILDFNTLLGPFGGWNFSGGVQVEWTRESGVGNSSFDELIVSFVPPVPALNYSDQDKTIVDEDFGMRFTRIPFTTVFAEGRFRQENIGEYEEDAALGSPLDSDVEFRRQTEFRSRSYDGRAGFTTSPWQWFSFTPQLRRYENRSHYDNHLREDLTQSPPILLAGYPGFIRARDLVTDEAEVKAVLRPASWLKTTVSCRFVRNAYRTDTDSVAPDVSPGGEILAGQYHSQVYSLGIVLTPWQRLYFSANFSFQKSRTETADNGNSAIVPYTGDVYSAFASGTYVLTRTTDWLLAYTFSRADFSQRNFGDATSGGLPLGMRYDSHAIQSGISRRISARASVQVQYAYYDYDEPSSGGVNNYHAHGIFGLINYRFQ